MAAHPLQASVTLRRGHLYKYKSLRGQNFDHVVEIIRDCRIYCPRPSELNDPAECKPQLVIDDITSPTYRPRIDAWVRRCVAHRAPVPTEAEIQAELASLTQARLEELVAGATVAYHEEVNNRYRILSLADSPDNHHLWANYADGYGGVCLAFFVDPMFGSAFRVAYSDAFPAFDVTNNERFDTLVATALVKRTAWQGECEYRLIFSDPPLPEDRPLVDQKLRFPRELLTGVVFGYRVAADQRNTLLRIIREHAPHARVAEATGGIPFAAVRIV
jgi:hypothetical protein